MLIIAVISMLAAVTLYTTAVFKEKKDGIIKKHHLIIFVSGLFFDTLGTTVMSMMSDSFKFDIHGVTGLAALILMFFHVIFASLVYFFGKEKQKQQFHKYSFIIWLIWLIPFITGLILNMG